MSLLCVLVIAFNCFMIQATVYTVIMDTLVETAYFFEKAENTLRDISQKVCCGSDIPARDYISELKDCLARIRVLKVCLYKDSILLWLSDLCMRLNYLTRLSWFIFGPRLVWLTWLNLISRLDLLNFWTYLACFPAEIPSLVQPISLTVHHFPFIFEVVDFRSFMKHDTRVFNIY